MGSHERTNVIVVGAGASKEFGLPTGPELLSRIEQLANIGFKEYGKVLYGRHELYDAFKLQAAREENYDGTANEYLKVVREIRQNMPIAPSIDNFIHTHNANSRMVTAGKLLIAMAILDAERESTLFPKVDDERIPYLAFAEPKKKFGEIVVHAPRYSWLGEYFRLLVAERNFSEFLVAMGNVTFISFNYDRCIVHYIFHAAKQYFNLDESQQAELLDKIHIIHPYGSVGSYSPLQVKGKTGFGKLPSGEQLLNIAEGIKTFSEGLVEEGQTSEIHDAFASCDVAMFLGFGFLPLNVRLLTGNSGVKTGNRYNVKHVMGTALGMSEYSRNIVCDELSYSFKAVVDDSSSRIAGRKTYFRTRRDAQLHDLSCVELFQYYQAFFLRSNN